MENETQAEPTEFTVLSIDAWAEGEDSWTWNQWYTCAEKCPAELLTDDAALIAWFISEGFLHSRAAGNVYIDDDQYNKVVCESATHMPLFAVEYGSSF